MNSLVLKNLLSQTLVVDARLGERKNIRVILAPGASSRDLSSETYLEELLASPQIQALQVPPAKIDVALERTDSDGNTIQAVELMEVVMDATPDVSGGATTVPVGFQVVDKQQVPIRAEMFVQFRAFADVDLVNGSTATLDSESAGLITAGRDTNAIVVRTNSTGRFTCILENLNDNTVFLACDSAPGGPSVDARESESVTFGP